MAYFDNISVTKEPCSSYTYDDKGNPVSAKEGGAKTSCEYQSGTSILTKYTASTGVVTSFTYAPTTHNLNTVTSAGVTSTNSYNSAGLVTQTVSSGNGERQKTSSSYDAYGQRTAATDVNGTVTKYEYALGRRITGTTVGTQARQEFNYNSADRMTMTSMEGLAAHHYSYSNGQLSALARKSRVGTGAFTWQSYHFAYDPFGNMTKISVSGADNTAASAPSSAITLAQYRYENGVNNGRLQELTFGNGQTVQYTYDRFDRTTAEQYNNVTYEYTYDASGQLAKQSSTAGEEYNYEYDSLGRLIRSNEYNGGTLEQRTEHVYDASDRLTKQTWYNSGGTTTVTYAYSPTTGLLTSLNANIQGSSIPVTYTYQGANQLRSKIVGGVMVRAYNFRYNNDGSKSALPDYINYRDPAGELMCGDNCFYDESGRLIEIRDSATVNRTDVTPVTIATYGYDRQGQLTAATVGGTSYTYTYDTAGNIQSKQIGGTTTNYTYGNSAWRDLLTAYDGREISYDGCGNPTRYYDGSTFTWTQGRRLATATVGNTNISYTYDMAGVRSSKTVNGTEYKFTTLSGLVTRQTGGKTIDFIYDDSNQPLAMKYNGTLYYYILNAQGDVVRIIDGSRNVVASYSYDPWGKIVSSSGTLADVNPLRYRGYYYDSETGFYYLQSRYYDPEIGRFINADNQIAGIGGEVLGYNLFAYCMNNPVNMSDPSGYWPKWTTKLVAAVAVVAVVAVVAAVTVATAGAGTAIAAVAVGAAKGAAIGFTVGAATGAAGGAISHRISTGSWGGVGEAALNGMASGALSGAVGGAITGGITGGLSYNSGATSAGKGFDTYRQLRNEIGSPGAGNEWHHIVEQSQIAKSGFSPQMIQNTNNIMTISQTTHRAISGYYSSVQPFTNGMIVRNWLAGQSFSAQYEFGINVIKLFM